MINIVDIFLQMSLLRNTVLQGLCKLIYAKRICNPYLLTHLFVLWFNPELGKLVKNISNMKNERNLSLCIFSLSMITV